MHFNARSCLTGFQEATFGNLHCGSSKRKVLGAHRRPPWTSADPQATHTGWSPYSAIASQGSYIPLARTRQEREAPSDSRLSVEERYTSREEYLGLVVGEALRLIEGGYLLGSDLAALSILAKARNLFPRLRKSHTQDDLPSTETDGDGYESIRRWQPSQRCLPSIDTLPVCE